MRKARPLINFDGTFKSARPVKEIDLFDNKSTL